MRLPSPRILLHTSDDPGAARRALALAIALTKEFESASLVLSTGSPELSRLPPPDRVEIVKVPGFAGSPTRPLALERVRRLRRRLLASLFDAFLPDLVLLDPSSEEASQEGRALLVRVHALEAAHLTLENPHAPGEPCQSSAEGASGEACEPCIHRARASARSTYERLERTRRAHGS